MDEDKVEFMGERQRNIKIKLKIKE